MKILQATTAAACSILFLMEFWVLAAVVMVGFFGVTVRIENLKK